MSKEKEWEALKATFAKKNVLTWGDSITQHAEHESRNNLLLAREDYGVKKKRNGGYHNRKTKKRKV